MTRYVYGKNPVSNDRLLLDIVPEGYERQIPDKMIMDIWSHYKDIEIKTEKDPENEQEVSN